MTHVFQQLWCSLCAAGDWAGNLINNLCLLVFAAGASLVVSSVVTLTWPKWHRLGFGLSGMTVALAVFAWHSIQPPGPVDTDLVSPDATPTPSIQLAVLERLSQPWDSEDRHAKWPVCETLAVLSDIAYRTPVEAEEEVARLGFSKIMPLVENSMVGYVIWHENTAVVIFRGTNKDEASDWATNSWDATLNIPGGGIHKGFWLAYQSLKPQVLQVLSMIKPKHLWITGHSLGGAMALACAIDLTANEQMPFDGLITFGQPKVAREDLAQYVDTALMGRYARVVNGDDAVARIPPSKAFCGSLVWFTSKGVKRSRPLRQLFGASESDIAGSDEWVELAPLTKDEFLEWKNSHREAVEGGEPLPDEPSSYQGNLPHISDHDMAGYVNQIRKHLGFEPH